MGYKIVVQFVAAALVAGVFVAMKLQRSRLGLTVLSNLRAKVIVMRSGHTPDDQNRKAA